MKKVDLSIIIPIFNEEECIDALFDSLKIVVEKLLSEDKTLEVIIVDDHSGDSSWEKLEEIKKSYSWLRCIRLLRNSGSHVAIYAGLNQCLGESAFIISADLQAKPDLIFDFMKKSEEGFDVVLGDRQARTDPFFKKVISSIFNIFVSKFVMKNFPMNGGDVFLINRKITNAIVECNEKNVNIFVLILSLCSDVGHVNYQRFERYAGKSKWDVKKLSKLAYDTIITVSNIPFRFIFWVGVSTFVVSTAFTFLIIILKIMGKIPIEGWASILVAVSSFGSLILISVALLGEYLWRNFDQTRNRPMYIIDNELK
ncbi:MAG: glycosyltransferase family 2 protein [Halobacteriovoraceae bacterium]|jgi:polyisoprenyl-phosphate glycosyltransferase|nr:glycosyltransferase family 2 protein [Halobacteriovoraceae bacterium]MBT5094749.1 glycosyltransferase family 2 protein [Halobacteriovoraceae bacterium]